MPDRSEVIRILQNIHDNGDFVADLIAAAGWALELLREQEPTTYAYDEYVTPTCQNCGFHPFIAYIPTLERMEQKGYNYCPKCGRRIKWEVSGDDSD